MKVIYSIPVPEYPSCLQATLASLAPKASSQTVPQAFPLQTSIRPSRAVVPPTRRIAPWAQTAKGGRMKHHNNYESYYGIDLRDGVPVPPGWHLTPASSKWMQLWEPTGLEGQSASRLSVPLHPTLSRRIGPVP